MQVSLIWLVLSLTTCYGNMDIHVGGAIDIFQHFGNLGEVINLSPPDQSILDVFQQVLQTRSLYPHSKDVFDGDFQLELCDSLSQLKAALFKQYSIERCDRAWRAYTGGWSKADSAKHLGLRGINASLLSGSYGYVLIRLTKRHELIELVVPDGGLKYNITSEVTAGDVRSVMDFIRTHGSHYIDSYVTGDSLYQVYVFTPDIYEQIQTAIASYKQTNQGLEGILELFSPWHAQHIGHIVSASGDVSLEVRAAQRLISGDSLPQYPSLLRLHSHPELLQELSDRLGPRAVVAARLNTTAVLLQGDAQRSWYEEVLDNQLKLWDLSV